MSLYISVEPWFFLALASLFCFGPGLKKLSGYIKNHRSYENQPITGMGKDNFKKTLFSAAGSGLPELIGFLNGTFIRRIFNFKTYVAKFTSCVLSVGKCNKLPQNL